MIESAGFAPRTKEHPEASIECTLDHVKYLARAMTPEEWPHVQGAENPCEAINVAKGLVRDGYSDSEIAKVMGLNGMRVIREC